MIFEEVGIMNKFVLGIAAVLIMLVIAIISNYNNLVAMNENVSGKWSQVENQLQRRVDLIPNLVNTVKGYAVHEQQSIQAVADARAKMASAQGPVAKGEANSELSNALSRLLVVVENYPILKEKINLPTFSFITPPPLTNLRIGLPPLL